LLRKYEFTLVTRANLSSEEYKKTVVRYEDLMKKDGGEIFRKDDWGVKKLTFPIKKQFRGHFHLYNFIGHNSSLPEMERLLRIDDRILRHLTIRLPDNAKAPTPPENKED